MLSIAPSLPPPRVASLPVGPTAAAPSMTVSVIAHGGDPSGVNVSTGALASAFAAAVALARSSAALPAAAGSGGVLVDLGGGSYRVDAPLLLRGASGIRVAGGTLFSDASFPVAGCLLDAQGVSNLVFEDLTLDAARRGCGLRLSDALQVAVRSVFFLHYSSFGLWGDNAGGASHELLVSDSFFAEFMWGEPGFDDVSAQNGTAIFLDTTFYDSNFYSSIIRCTRVGVVNLAGANLWHGVHVYSTCNKDPSGGNVSIGFLQGAWGQTRIAASYFDDSPLVVVSAQDLTVKDNLFYGLSALIFAPHEGSAAAGAFVSGNVFTRTPYSGLGPAIHYDVGNGTYPAALQGVVVSDNGGSSSAGAGRAPLRATRVAATLLAARNDSAGGPLPLDFAAQLDLRGSLLFVAPSDARAPPPAWRAAAAPHLAAVARAARERAPPAAAAGAAPPPPAPPLGGVLAQLTAFPALVSLAGPGGGALSPAACGASAAAAVAPAGGAPGVLDAAVTVNLGACANASAWAVLVTVHADQAQPDVVAW